MLHQCIAYWIIGYIINNTNKYCISYITVGVEYHCYILQGPRTSANNKDTYVSYDYCDIQT